MEFWKGEHPVIERGSSFREDTYEKYEVKEEGKGIYRVKGLLFPLQILITGQLNPALHGWLHSLTRTIEQESAENLLNNYSGLEDGKINKMQVSL